MKILRFCGKFVLTTVCLFSVSSLTSCGSSTDVTVIAVNQANGTNKIQMNTPKNNTQNIESAPVDLSKIPTVTYCELIKNAAEYDKKIVRVRAIYFTAFERTFLYDENCKPDQPPTAPEKVPAETWAQWDKTLVSQGDSIEAKTNRQLNGFGRKDVTIIGKFNSTNEQSDPNMPNLFGHLNCCRYQFSIMKLEKLDSDIKE
jgi:hypothetical protein